MTRQFAFVFLMLSSLLVNAGSVLADQPVHIEGGFQFLHDAVDPNDATLCLSPVPGLAFNNVPGDFVGQASGIGSFFGTGTADTCAFFQPFFGIFARFNGSFQWEVESGEILSGEFFGIDFNPLAYSPDGQPIVFETSILVIFRDASGRFAGLAFAEGVDDPFGALSGNPASAGVTASIDGVLF